MCCAAYYRQDAFRSIFKRALEKKSNLCICFLKQCLGKLVPPTLRLLRSVQIPWRVGTTHHPL